MKRTLVFLFLVLLIIAGTLGGSYRGWMDTRTCASGTTPSSLTFAYSDLRAGSTPSCLSSRSFSGFDLAKVELPFTTTPAMLLYWNGLQDTTFPLFSGKRVLLGQAYPAGVYAYDLDAHAVLWRHDFYADTPGLHRHVPINSSAPVIDHDRRRLYGTFIEERYLGKKATDSRLTQHYYSISLDGTSYEEMAVDLSRFVLEKGVSATPDDIAKYVRCRAALGLSLETSPHYVFSGCSIVRAFSFEGTQFVHQASSQTVKGIRGLLLTLPVDSVTGRFAPLKMARAFIPSKLGSGPGAGVDAGIWHSGGAPAILPGKQILLATGNGVYLPEQGVYGCAVVRLNAESLAVEEPGGSYFSARGEDPAKASAHCHEANLDPSSSSPATLEIGGSYFSTIGGKDGWLKSFDPFHLPGSTASPHREREVVKGFLFGQPVVFQNLKHNVISVIGGNGANGVEWAGFAQKPDYSLERLWTIRDSHPRAYNSSATGTYREAGRAPLLLIPLASGTPQEGFPSSLQVVDANTGKVLGEVPFHGATHFSMPTVVDDRVFVPTAEHGIYEFRARTSFHDYLVVHAPFFARLF